MNHHNIQLLFKSGLGPDTFGATMSQKRMRFVLAHITFNDKNARKDRWPSDGSAAGRDMFDMFNKMYYICATEDYVKYLVNEVEKDTSLKECNISTDHLYTSALLARWLLDRDIATVGTLSTVRIGIPDELKGTECRENFSVTCHVESKENKSVYNNLFSENKIHWT